MKYRVKRNAVTQPRDQSYRIIPLTQGQNALVDADDFEHLSAFNWHALWSGDTQTFYAARHQTRQSYVYMHREILGCTASEEGDHRSHDTLDNRKQNLRKCTHKENGRNTVSRSTASGYKGVSWSAKRQKWESKIAKNGKTIHLGRFPSKETAARAYDEAAKIYHGEFAHLNFPASSQ